MRSKAKLTLAALGFGVAVAAGIAGPAFASSTGQPTGTTPVTAAPQTSVTTGTSSQAGVHMGKRADFEKDLAAKLGVPSQKLTAAVKDVRTELRQSGKTGTRSARADEFANLLAGKLSLDPTKVRDAMRAVHAQELAERQAQRQARVDRAVQSGKISQSDASTYLRVRQSLEQAQPGM
jgi:hypothetical protein